LLKKGEYTLPVIELKWWNISTDHIATAKLPALNFTVMDNANYLVEIPPVPSGVVEQKRSACGIDINIGFVE
jgi:hypothetical protein